MALREKLFQFNCDLPLERARTIPSVWYSDREIFELEKRVCFLNHWQLVGHAEKLREPGSFVTINLVGESVVVTRDREGTLRAFSNVCRHRGACVVNKPEGMASFFQCRYHGWTYDLRGRLKGTPEFDGVENFFREENSLPAWSVESWSDFVFVHGGRHAVPLPEELAPFFGRSAAFGLSELRWVNRREYVLECNWKIFVDNYLDGGYHVNTLHPNLAGVIDYPNYRVEILGNCIVQTSPLKPDAEGSKLRSGREANYWWIYPNLMVNLYEGIMDTNVVIPIDENRCRVIFDYFFAADLVSRDPALVQKSMDVAHKVQLEDSEICEEVQRNLTSRSYDTGRFSVRREGGGHHFHQMLAQELQVSVS